MDKHTSYSVSDYDALMKSNIPQALKETAGMRFDSAEDASVFFARELDYIKAKSYDKLYPQFTALSLFPISSEIDPGAETFTYYSYDKTGVAKIINNYATDLPRADVKGKPTTGYIKSVGDSYGYSVQEMRASRMAGKSLDVRKAESARFQIESLLNRIAWAGDKENNLIGVLSPENDIPLYTVAQNGQGKTDWKSKTPDEILADIRGMLSQVTETTMDVERPDTLVLPSSVYVDLSLRQIPNTGYTVLRFLQENLPDITFAKAAELQSNAIGVNPYAKDQEGKNVALLFTNDPDKITIEHPLPFYQYPLQTRGLEVIVPCEARTAGAVIYYPLSAIIAVGV